MKAAKSLLAGIVLAGLLHNVVSAQEIEKAGAGRNGDEPNRVITPNTIRIQPVDQPEKGKWVVMPGFSELGSPTFSKDGRWIAFDAYKEGYNNSPSECWIVQRDGKGLRRLAMGATPRWSPDGKWLLFMRSEANDRKREPGIFIIERDRAHERRITDGRWPDWSPDGKQITFSVGGIPTGGSRQEAVICTANADGSDRKEIAVGDCPSWSPDGKKIAYCFKAANEPPLIRVHDLEAGTDVTLGIGWFRANWMPDSKTLVANGIVGRQPRMVRLFLNAQGRTQELRHFSANTTGLGVVTAHPSRCVDSLARPPPERFPPQGGPCLGTKIRGNGAENRLKRPFRRDRCVACTGPGILLLQSSQPLRAAAAIAGAATRPGESRKFFLNSLSRCPTGVYPPSASKFSNRCVNEIANLRHTDYRDVDYPGEGSLRRPMCGD